METWKNANDAQGIVLLHVCLFGFVSFVVFRLVVVSLRSWAVSLVGPRAYNILVVLFVFACTSKKAYHDATEAPWFFWMASKTDPWRFMTQWVASSVFMLFMCDIFGFLAPRAEETERGGCEH